MSPRDGTGGTGPGQLVDARGGRLENIHFTVADDAICASTPSDALEPYSQEYEGYMGNFGNTLDRCYHRGAVLVWPRGQGSADD